MAERTCTIGDCNRPLNCRGMCEMHYARLRRTGTTDDPPAPKYAKRRSRPHPRKPCPGCGDPIGKYSARCQACYHKSRMGRPVKQSRKPHPSGYVMLGGHYGHPNANATGLILEHRLVMVEMLGRPLRKGENVHHKNGDRADNRPENLELWVSSQPVGQRPEDLVVWAREIIELYGG